MPQYTLSQAAVFDGVGLHTGIACCVRALPAEPGTGIVFALNGMVVPARAGSILSTRRAVTLGNEGARVSTVEHVLASLSALEIDNAVLEVSGPEIPALDGSATPFVEGLTAAGRKKQPGNTPVIRLTGPVWIAEGEALLLALPADAPRRTYIGSFGAVPDRSLSWRITPTVFAREVAPARTVVFRTEVESLLSQDLGLGGSLDTVVVIESDGACSSTRLPDEPLRHKMLDLIGDLSLLGARLQAHVIAIRSGHRLNLELVKEILQQTQTNLEV